MTEQGMIGVPLELAGAAVWIAGAAGEPVPGSPMALVPWEAIRLLRAGLERAGFPWEAIRDAVEAAAAVDWELVPLEDEWVEPLRDPQREADDDYDRSHGR